jgi:hypothetical protein
MNMPYDNADDAAPSSIVDIQPVTLAGMRFIMSFYGLSESGKTLSALKVAAGMEPDPMKRALLDTEGGQRGRMYANDIPGGFLYAHLTPPYTPERYVQAVDSFAKKGVTVLVTDSASHAWFAEGGVLEMVENSTLKNDMAKWKDPKRRLGRMLQRYRSSDMHHILCSRAKQPLIEVAGENGKKKLVPGPIVPIQDKMLRYDMTIVALFLGRGKYTIAPPDGKCPGPLLPVFAGHEYLDEDIGRKLIAWIGANGMKSAEHRALENDANDAANEGREAFVAFWKKLDPQQRGLLAPTMGNYQSIAAAADAEAKRVKDEAERSGETTTGQPDAKPTDQKPADQPPAQPAQQQTGQAAE